MKCMVCDVELRGEVSELNGIVQYNDDYVLCTACDYRYTDEELREQLWMKLEYKLLVDSNTLRKYLKLPIQHWPWMEKL